MELWSARRFWLAEADGSYYLFSEGNAGKVKRIRANGRTRLAPCDLRGKIDSGWLEARGRVVREADTIERAYIALRRKYGWQMKVGDFFSRLTGRYDKRAIIELQVIDSNDGREPQSESLRYCGLSRAWLRRA